MNYGKVFKVFLHLKKNEIVRMFWNCWDSITDVLKFIGIGLACLAGIIIFLFITAGLGHLFVYLFNSSLSDKPYNDYMNYGFFAWFLIVVALLVLYVLIRFGVWIWTNWETAKGIVEREGNGLK